MIQLNLKKTRLYSIVKEASKLFQKKGITLREMLDELDYIRHGKKRSGWYPTDKA